jgi:hypothetical protein
VRIFALIEIIAQKHENLLLKGLSGSDSHDAMNLMHTDLMTPFISTHIFPLIRIGNRLAVLSYRMT